MDRRHQETNQQMGHLRTATSRRQPPPGNAVDTARPTAVAESRRRVQFRPTEAFQRPLAYSDTFRVLTTPTETNEDCILRSASHV